MNSRFPKGPDDAGLPRKTCLWEARHARKDEDGAPHPLDGKLLPVPWINGEHPFNGDWIIFRTWTPKSDVYDPDIPQPTPSYYPMRLCAVCGETLGERFVYLRNESHSTSGPGCHPVCAALSLRFCPHLVDMVRDDPDTFVGWLWTGPVTQTEDDWRVRAGTPRLHPSEIRALARLQAQGDALYTPPLASWTPPPDPTTCPLPKATCSPTSESAAS